MKKILLIIMIISLSCKKNNYEKINNYIGTYYGTYSYYYCFNIQDTLPEVSINENVTMEIYRAGESALACKSNFLNYVFTNPMILNDYQLAYSDTIFDSKLIRVHEIKITNQNVLTYNYKTIINRDTSDKCKGRGDITYAALK